MESQEFYRKEIHRLNKAIQALGDKLKSLGVKHEDIYDLIKGVNVGE